MPTSRAPHANIDEYIESFSPDVQAILEKIRLTIRNAAPAAEETISYRMPAFRLNGILVYFAALQEAHRTLSTSPGRCKVGEGNLTLCRTEGQSSISTRSADSVRPHRENCEAQSEAELSESGPLASRNSSPAKVSLRRRPYPLRQRTTERQHIPIWISHHKVAHPIRLVRWLKRNLCPALLDRCPIGINLVRKHNDCPAAKRPLPGCVRAQVKIAFAKMQTRIWAELKVLMKAKHVAIEAKRCFEIFHLEDS